MTQNNADSTANGPLRKLDWLLMGFAVALLLFLTWFRRHGIFWSDEIMGWTTIWRGSWHQVFQAWSNGVDSSGLFFTITARLWLEIFGATLLSLHFYSAFFTALSFVVLWICARRFAPLPVVAFAMPFVFLVNHGLALQLCNGRTYGVVLFAVSLTCYALLRTDASEPDFHGWTPLLLSFAAFLILASSHVLGVLFVGVFLAGFIARDLVQHVFQPKIYAAALLALAIILPISRRNILADIAMGNPTFWTPLPTARDFLYGTYNYTPIVGGLIGLLLLAVLASSFRQRSIGIKPRAAATSRNVSLYCIYGSFVLLLLISFALSLLGKSIFTDRYMMPVALGDALLICDLMGRLWPLFMRARGMQIAYAVLAILGLASIYRFNLHRDGYPIADFTPALLRAIPVGEPVVMTDINNFIEIVFYRNNDRQFLTPLDWKIQTDPNFGPGGASLLHQMEDWKKSGIYPNQIQPTSYILGQYSKFVVVSDNRHTLWLRRYILQNPAYKAARLPSYENDQIWQVEKR